MQCHMGLPKKWWFQTAMHTLNGMLVASWLHIPKHGKVHGIRGVSSRGDSRSLEKPQIAAGLVAQKWRVLNESMKYINYLLSSLSNN
jgi:hypothetical protein